jgi:hypothetical protein
MMNPGDTTMIFADTHDYARSGDLSIWPYVLILGLLALIVALIVFVFLRRTPRQSDGRPNAAEGQLLTPPGAPASTSQIPIQPQTAGGHPVQQAATTGDYVYCDDTILNVLRQKGRPMTQKEVCEDTRLTEQEVAGALAFMEERCLVKRTWDHVQSTYIVEAT